MPIRSGKAFEPGEDVYGASHASAPALPVVLTSCAFPQWGSHPRAGQFEETGQNGIRSIPRMRQNGTIKFFNQAKGYGFVSPEGGGKDVFVHITAVQRSGIPELNEGMRISFEVQPDKRGRGPQAVELQLL
jgi:CspA family cold shock protein